MVDSHEFVVSVPDSVLTPSGSEFEPVEAIPIYIEELLLLLTCYVEGTS